MLKINYNETRQKRTYLNLLSQKSKLLEYKQSHTWHSKSFELPSNSLVLCNQQRRKLSKLKTNLNISNTQYFRQSARKSFKTEKFDTIDAISAKNQIIYETPVKSCVIRRVSQYEYIGSKQKRLNSMTSSIQVYQHSKDAAILKKKKMNRLKMQYSIQNNQLEFTQRSNHKKNYRHHKSRSAKLPAILKIIHKRSKTDCNQQYEGPIKKLEPDLERKINLLLKRKKDNRLNIRRRTFIQEPKQSVFVSRDKLLKYHEIMDNKFAINYNQYDSSGESTPANILKVQFKKRTLNKLHQNNSGNHQYLTPRLYNEQNNNIFTRKTSHSVITQYVIEKNKKIKNILKLPDIIQPSLNEFNQYLIAQKRTTQQQIQIQSQDYLTKQIQLNNKQTQFIHKQLKIIKQDSQICNSTRIKTLPSETTSSRNKINLQQKLWPYFQQLK